MRPQVISYLLVAVDRGRLAAGPRDRAGAVVAGPGDLGLGDVPRDVAGRDRHRRRRGRRPGARPRASAAPPWPGWPPSRSLSAVVSLLTPVGPGLFAAVLLVNSRGQYFYEWAPPDFTKLQQRGAARAAGASTGRRDAARPGDAVLDPDPARLLAGGWAVYSLRTVPVAAALLVPLAAMRAAAAPRARRPTVSRRERVAGRRALRGRARRAGRRWCRRTADQPPRHSPTGSTRRSAPCPRAPSCSTSPLVRRLPDVALPPPRPDDARVRRHLHPRRAAAELRHRARWSPGWVELVRDSDVEYAVLDPESTARLRAARAGGLDGRPRTTRTSRCSSRRPAGWTPASR